MNLSSLVEKTHDADILCEMIWYAAERLMEVEVGALTGAGHGEKARCSGPNATTTVIGSRRNLHAR